MSDEQRESAASDHIAGLETPPARHTLSTEALEALFERHNLPRPAAVMPLPGFETDGWLLVDGAIVVRRGEPQDHALAKEALIYRRLRRATDVPCPEVLALDRQHDLVPYDVLMLGYVHGANGTLVWEGLDEHARERLFEEVGRMVGTVHGLQWAAFGDFNPDTRTFGQYPRWTDMLLHRLAQVVEEARSSTALPQPLIDGALTELNDGDSILETSSPPALAHGALHTGNLLLSNREDGWHVAAILDWEHALTTDAAWEFAALGFGRSDDDPVGDAFLYGYRERHALQSDLRSRTHLYRVMLHLEGAVHATDDARRREHERALLRLLRGR